MNKLPENSDQTKNVKKSPSITRIATRGIINIFVPLMETRLITNSVQHMLEQQKRRLDRFRQVNNKKAQLHLTWEEALQASHMSVDDLDRRFAGAEQYGDSVAGVCWPSLCFSVVCSLPPLHYLLRLWYAPSALLC